MEFKESSNFVYIFRNSDNKSVIISSELLAHINEIISDTGCSLSFVDKYVYDTSYTSKLQVLHEEVLFDNMSSDEKIRKICSEIEAISKECKCRDELIIIDRYLFPKSATDDYKNLLIKIIKRSRFSKILVITGNGRKEYNSAVRRDIEKKLAGVCKIIVKRTDKIHDRFWIANREKSFVMGTSLNGLGGRLCYIDVMKPDDTRIVLNYLYNEGLIDGVTL